jgi:hypothetical protein
MELNFALDLKFSIACLAFCRMLYYYIGEPASDEYNPKAIFAGFVPFIVKWAYMGGQLNKVAKGIETYSQREYLVSYAKQQGGIASIFGTCYICFSFWVLGFTYLISTQDILGFFILQLLNKILIKWT